MFVVVCALLLTVAPALAASQSTGSPVGTVAFVGDSNLVLPATQISLELLNRDRGWVMVNVARPGTQIRTDGGAFWQERLAALNRVVDPDVYFVDLGINDTTGPGTPTGPGYTAYAAKVDWLLGQLEPGVPVVWSNLPCKIETAARAKGCATVNHALAGARARHPNLRVLDWAKIANGHHDWIAPDKFRVHYSLAGSTAFAHAIAQSLKA